MKKHADKPRENNSHAVANNLSKPSSNKHIISFKLQNDKLNVVGEDHEHSEPIRESEKNYNASLGISKAAYFKENEFTYTDPKTSKQKPADDPMKRVVFAAAKCYELLDYFSDQLNTKYNPENPSGDKEVLALISGLEENIKEVNYILSKEDIRNDDKTFKIIRRTLEERVGIAFDAINALKRKLINSARPDKEVFKDLMVRLIGNGKSMRDSLAELNGHLNLLLTGKKPTEGQDSWFRSLPADQMLSATSMNRSAEFHTAAQVRHKDVAVWKVGYIHFAEMEMVAEKDKASYHAEPMDKYDKDVEEFTKKK